MAQYIIRTELALEDTTYDFLFSIANENKKPLPDVIAELIEREVKHWKEDLDMVKQLQELESIADTDPQLRLS